MSFKNISVTRGLRPVAFAEAIACIRYREDTVLLRGDLEVIRFSVVLRRRRRLLTLRRRWQWRHGHRVLLLVDQIRDEHSGDGVFLAAELRKVNLPDVFNTR